MEKIIFRKISVIFSVASKGHIQTSWISDQHQKHKHYRGKSILLWPQELKTNMCSCLYVSNSLKRDVVVQFLDIGRIVDHHCSNFFFTILANK
jgi:hypothetical protein